MNARGLPLGLTVATLRALLPIARTWRIRSPDDPTRPLRVDPVDVIYATWHEHLLPFSWLFAGHGAATLASLGRDGEIIARILATLGYAVARGSSTRGGSEGFRGLTSAARAGRPIIITCDGPRGPRRVMKRGTARLSSLTERPVVPVGLAATPGWRLASWDRFLIPAPGALILVSFGSPRLAGPESTPTLGADLGREIERCEIAANEARWMIPPRITRGSIPGPRPSPVAVAGIERSIVPRLERPVRATWRTKVSGPTLRVAAAGFGAGSRVRNALFETGILETLDGGVPVVSIGGVTVGGSGKTPIASHVAGLLSEEGHRVAILARGYEDELRLHKLWRPDIPVWGHPDRVRTARRAAAEGATVAVLDDGFQHRRLHRDADIVLLDRDALRRASGSLLPAGPFREPWRRALRRADIVLVTGREPWRPEIASFDARLGEELAELCPRATTASLSFEVGEVIALNAGARAWPDPAAPGLALTGIMKPNLFFDLAIARCPSVKERLALPDHGTLPANEWSTVLTRGGKGGMIMTWKDVCRMGSGVPESVPLWALGERLSWHRGEADLAGCLIRLVPAPTTEDGPRQTTEDGPPQTADEAR